MQTPEPPSQDSSGSLERASRIIEVVASSTAPMTIADIERATRLPKATAYRLTRQLVDLELLQVEPGSKRHSEGPRLRAMSWHALNSTTRSLRLNVLAGLVDDVQETCFVAAHIDGQLLVIDSIVSPHALCVNVTAGMRLPLHATACGKLVLAGCTQKERDVLIGSRPLTAITAGTITSRAKLEGTLAEVSQFRIGTEDGEHSDGVVGIAVPVEARNNRMIGTLGLSAPAIRLGLHTAQSYVPKLQDAARRIAQTLGA